ncbi:ABC transporter ATP-binding protein [Synechococcus sp. PCC 7336]|uniref:ABC transporter ATP-binding protein n=1 Tax=Synechococcus sp. PCC 7336 TaxID=195250 RepID=UPI000344D880|nr:ABC transporter ATP-binding protein [Synechococcus sp. PCC 7336]
MKEPILSVRDLKIAFRSHDRLTTAVNQLDFDLASGQTLGIVGESGSGKTVTSLAIMGLLPPATTQISGAAYLRDRPDSDARVNLLELSSEQMRAYRGDRIAMVFQEPTSALNPVYTCGFQVIETIVANENVSQAEARQRTLDLFREVQLPDPERILNRYPHQLSGGQMQRVTIAIALSCNPEILIADEPTTALDVTVQAEILRLLEALQQRRNMAILFITHDLGVIADIADSVVVMYRGQRVERGTVSNIFHNPQSPYTKGLLTCRPSLDRRMKVLPTTADFMEVKERSDGTLDIVEKRAGSVRQALLDAEMSRSELEVRLARLRTQKPLLQVRHLKTYFPVRQGVFGRQTGVVKAVDDVSFDLYPGETLGLVGESGCGKSTLGRSILQLIRPTAGEVIYDGDDLATLSDRRLRSLRKHLQIIFQDPFSSLDPRMSVGASVMEPMDLHGIGRNRAERRQKAAELLEKVGLDGSVLRRMPHEFSGGQRQRVCIARALASSPQLIICDESVSALDVSVQAQVLNLLKDLQAEFELSYLFISHDLSVVKFISDRIMVMNRGRIEEIATADDLYTNPQNDYTRSLISAIPGASLAQI